MGTATTGDSELIRVTAIDYLSGDVLLDSLVWPDIKMAHYNTAFSGVTRQAMNKARRDATCIFGRDAAREAIWKFVGLRTIVVGHGGAGDLTCLRWIHRDIVDTCIVENVRRLAIQAEKKPDDGQVYAAPAPVDTDEKETSPAPEFKAAAEKSAEKTGGLSLKALALEHLNRTIQPKGRGHDSLEDAVATRDLLHFQITRAIQEKRGGKTPSLQNT
jgi:RNA exonuclease 1